MVAQDPDTKEILRYKGWDESLAFIKDYIALHGPFDGFWAFSQACALQENCLGCLVDLSVIYCTFRASIDALLVPRAQGTILASLLLAMKQQNLILQVRKCWLSGLPLGCPASKTAVVK